MKIFFSKLKGYLVYFLLFVILVLAGIIFALSNKDHYPITSTVVPSVSPSQDLAATVQITYAPSATMTHEITPTEMVEDIFNPFPDGLILMSLYNGSYFAIYSYHPQVIAFTQLFVSDWDELEPALSPDGSKLAYRSNQSGFWDIYIRDIGTGETTNISHSDQYDGAPSWSPDSQWLVYETYQQDNFDLIIQSIADLESSGK